MPNRKSRAPGERPSVDAHIESFAVRATLESPSKVLLVDDVVTKGAKLMAAAVKLGQAFQAARIEAFALLRYRGLVPDIEMFIDPCIGKITFDGADTIWREP